MQSFGEDRCVDCMNASSQLLEVFNGHNALFSRDECSKMSLLWNSYKKSDIISHAKTYVKKYIYPYKNHQFLEHGCPLSEK